MLLWLLLLLLLFYCKKKNQRNGRRKDCAAAHLNVIINNNNNNEALSHFGRCVGVFWIVVVVVVDTWEVLLFLSPENRSFEKPNLIKVLLLAHCVWCVREIIYCLCVYRFSLCTPCTISLCGLADCQCCHLEIFNCTILYFYKFVLHTKFEPYFLELIEQINKKLSTNIKRTLTF